MKIQEHKFNKIIFVAEVICSVLICFAVYKEISPIYGMPMFGCEALYEPYINAITWDLDNSFVQILVGNSNMWVSVSVIQVLILRYLPDTLNIHPLVFMENYYKFLLFGYLMLLFFALVKNFTKYFEKFYFSFLIIPFPATLFLSSIIEIPALWILTNSSWCTAYILLTSIMLFFLMKTEYLFVNFQKPDKKEISLTIFFVLCLAISPEIFRFMLCCISLLLLIISKIAFNFKIRKQYILYWFLLFFVCYFPLLFKISFADLNFRYLSEYFSGFFEYVIMQNLSFIIVLAGLFVLIFFFVKNKEKNKRLFIYTITLIVSMFLFFAAAVIFNQYDNFLFKNWGLRILMITIFIFSIFSVTGYLLKMTDNIKLRKILTGLIVFAQIIAFIRVPDFEMITYNDFLENNERKQMLYMMEKLFVLYGKEHKKFYYINKKYIIDELSLIYLLDRYDKKAHRKNYEHIEVCNATNTDDYTPCKDSFLKLIEEKTGDKNTQEELNNLDFTVFDKYTETFRRK